MVPVRAAPVFAATEYVTVPEAVPEAPPITVIQAALLTAVQPHPDAVVTVAKLLPPLLPTDCVVGLTV